MLSVLYIQNYALIRQLEIDFSGGLSVITGETGAGKSIFLGAIGLVLGKRADTQVLLDKTKKCIVEGTFKIDNYGLESFFDRCDIDYEPTTILRRELNSFGKSRAFINDTPVNLSIIKELGEKLIDLHSQHQTNTLIYSDFQLTIIDSYGGNNDIVKNYKKEFEEYNDLINNLMKIRSKEKESKIENDFLQFQLDELTKAQLIEGEQEELENKLHILNHAEEIKSQLHSANISLQSGEINLINNLSDIRNNIARISNYGDNLKDLTNRLESSAIELSDIASELEKIEESIIHDPVKITEVNERLDLIYGLQNKHRVNSIRELIKIKQDIGSKLNNIERLGDTIKNLESKVNSFRKSISGMAKTISKKRVSTFKDIEREIENSLKSLGMPEAKFRINHEALTDPGKDGTDNIKFTFTANKGEGLQDISKVASGGERSRLMLALKSLISQKNLLPTIIFDEIDSGVSGTVANKAGNILHKLSKSMQVIAITHLPQIAGKGDAHYLVHKKIENDISLSRIKKLNSDERILEIASMLSGQDVTTASMETARHLLRN